MNNELLFITNNGNCNALLKNDNFNNPEYTEMLNIQHIDI